MVKRLVDITGAVIGLVVLSPLFALAALAVLRSLGRPILFRQQRPGLHGKLFSICKFRTMRPARGDEVWYRTDALRMSRVGRFLRKTSIDELPELWNVLRGEMSLVGPRPLLPEYLAIYTPEHARRHELRPGITGWAQVQGRQSISFSRRLELDVWYVDHFSLRLDIRILLMTIRDVLHGRGVLPGQDIDEVDDLDLIAGLSAATGPERGARRHRLDGLRGYSMRPPESRDVDDLLPIKNDPEIAALLVGTTRPWSRASLQNWVEHHRTARDEAFFVIADPADRPVGYAALYRIDRAAGNAEFGILLGDKLVWGKGIGSRVTRFMVEYGFDVLDLRRVFLEVLETNARAKRVYDKLGFTVEGRLRQHQVKDGQPVDVFVMGLLRTDYQREDPETATA